MCYAYDRTYHTRATVEPAMRSDIETHGYVEGVLSCTKSSWSDFGIVTVGILSGVSKSEEDEF